MRDGSPFHRETAICHALKVKTMRDWLSQRAVASPETTALIGSNPTVTDTYADLDETVEEIAARLTTLGIGPGSHVGLLVSSSPAAVRLIHATMRVGAVVVPLSTEQTESELAPQIERADLALLVCEREMEILPTDIDVPVRTISALADEVPTAFDPPEWKQTDPLAMLYTSGTTGQPKLVVLTVKNVCSSAVASAVRLGVLPGDRWCSPLALHHMGGLAPIYRSVVYGTGLILAPTDAEPLLTALTDHKATGVSLVPVMLDRLLSTDRLPDSLRFVLLGGAPASDDLIERCAARDVPVCPSYGMTETASQIATARPTEATTNVGTVGRPLFSTTVTILNENDHPLPMGERGAIVVSGPTVTPGYYSDLDYSTPNYSDLDSTATEFCSYGFRTGDLGHFDEDGRLWVGGRASDRIVTGGETVDPREVVSVLREHSAIDDAAVVGLSDDEWGECVGALIEQESGVKSLDRETVESHCRAHLAAHKLPRVVAYGSIPRTESGTVDRETVRAYLEETQE
jgi:O-succinylbenzoic acid--CoA ligase